jgi:hypothetical protein
MSGAPRIITRIALFSALGYVFSLTLTVWFPNVNLIFFISFAGGFLWGAWAGMLVGAIGMGLWSVFNPLGPADPFTTAAQIVGMALSGLIGAGYARSGWQTRRIGLQTAWLVALALVCTGVFYLVVGTVDAWIYQPFWPRFVSSMIWALPSVISNGILFPLLFVVIRHLYARESTLSWSG